MNEADVFPVHSSISGFRHEAEFDLSSNLGIL